MVVNLANFIEYFATPISGQVTFQRQGYESDLAFAMDAKCGRGQVSVCPSFTEVRDVSKQPRRKDSFLRGCFLRCNWGLYVFAL